MGIECFVSSCADTGALVDGHVVQSRRVAEGVQYALLDYEYYSSTSDIVYTS